MIRSCLTWFTKYYNLAWLHHSLSETIQLPRILFPWEHTFQCLTHDSGTHLPLWSIPRVGVETTTCSHFTPSSTIREGRQEGSLDIKNKSNGVMETLRHRYHHQWILNENPRVTHSYRDEKNHSAATVW